MENLHLERILRPLKRELSPRRRTNQEQARFRPRSRSMSVTAAAKYQSFWSIKSQTNPTCREVRDMFTRMWKKHGPAKDWPSDARIFDSEGPKFRKHISKRGWTKDHIPIWCQDAIEARAKENGGIKKGPPGGLYFVTISRQEPHEAMEDASCAFLHTLQVSDGSTVGTENRHGVPRWSH